MGLAEQMGCEWFIGKTVFKSCEKNRVFEKVVKKRF